MTRARFIDADGISTFGEVFENGGIWKRVAYEPVLYPDGTDTGLRDMIGIDTFRREFWVYPYGPFACPEQDRNGDWFDVCYRFESREHQFHPMLTFNL